MDFVERLLRLDITGGRFPPECIDPRRRYRCAHGLEDLLTPDCPVPLGGRIPGQDDA